MPPRPPQIVLAILGLYAGIAGYYQIKGGFAKAQKVMEMPAPSKPDFHTREFSTLWVVPATGLLPPSRACLKPR